MENSRETISLNFICILLILGAGILRIVTSYHTTDFGINGIILVLFSAAILIWTIQFRRRLLSMSIRRHLTAASCFMMLWMVLRTVKYEFFENNYLILRHLWYLYYIPMIFVPLHMFLAVRSIGTSKDSKPDRRWNLLYLVAALLVVLVLTNDIHQLAFHFFGRKALWSDKNYVHGPVYYAIVLWMAVLLISTIALAFFKCAVSSSRKKIWIPMVPVAIGILYTVLYLLKIENVLRIMFRVPEMWCFLFATFIESLILIHLVPSNDSYADFFHVSSLGAVLMDDEGHTFCCSEQGVSVSPKQVKQALTEEIPFDPGKSVLKSSRIPGGYCYWIRDISYVKSLNDKLAELGNVLEEENAVLNAEHQLYMEKERIHNLTAIYDDISECIRPELDKIRQILDTPAEKEEDFLIQMKYACILNVYVKRYSNLFLLSRQTEKLNGKELWLALSESLNYIELYGIKTHGSCRGEAMIPGNQILMLYQLFEYVVESVVFDTTAFLVDLSIYEDSISLHMTTDVPKKPLTKERMQTFLSEFPGSLSVHIEQQTEYITLILPTGREPL